MNIEVSTVFCYDFLEHKSFKKNKNAKQMIYDFVEKIKKEIEEIKSNPKKNIANLFNGKDNDSLFYEGTEEKIKQKDISCFQKHQRSFLSENNIVIFKSTFIKTKISNENKAKRLLSYIFVGTHKQFESPTKNSEKYLKDIKQKTFSEEKSFILIIYPIEIDNYH